MTFKDLPAGVAVFLDSNILVYHFGPHLSLGLPCRELLKRIERQEIMGFVSAAGLSDMAHKLMCEEAATTLGWARQGITRQLRRHPTEVCKLTHFRDAVDEVPRFNVTVLDINDRLVTEATAISQQTGLLSGDALVIAVMRDHGLAHLASNDADFDRVPGITRYAPV